MRMGHCNTYTTTIQLILVWRYQLSGIDVCRLQDTITAHLLKAMMMHTYLTSEPLQTSWQTGWSVSSNNCKSESEEGRLTNTKTAIRCQYTQSHDVNSNCPSFLLLQATSYRANTNIAVVSCRQMHGNNSSAVGITHQEGQQPISHIISWPNRWINTISIYPQMHPYNLGAITLHYPA